MKSITFNLLAGIRFSPKFLTTLLLFLILPIAGLSQTQIGLDIDGEATDDLSSRSVSLSADGSVVAIGAYLNDGNGPDSGHVRVYQNSGGTWTQVGSDIDGEAAVDQSGYSVSLSANGSVVAIGAWGNDGNGNFSGHVRVYQNSGGTWTQVGSDIDGEAANDGSGYSVSLSADGSVVAIGAIFNIGNGSNSGHVRVYQNSGGTWTQVGSDIDGEAANDLSSRSVSLSADGSVVAIGANGNDGNSSNSGHVRVYQNSGGTWTQVGSDIDGEAADDQSGVSVSLSADGSVVAIGAFGNDGNGNSSGHVRVYQNSGGTWTQVGSDIDGEAAYDESGYSVSLSANGSVVAIGAHLNDGNGGNSGHVRVYQNSGGTWTQVGSDIDGEAADDQSGDSVSLSANGSVVAIGAVGNDENGSNSGHVRVYDTSDPSLCDTVILNNTGEDLCNDASPDNFIPFSIVYDGWGASCGGSESVVGIGYSTSFKYVVFKETEANLQLGDPINVAYTGWASGSTGNIEIRILVSNDDITYTQAAIASMKNYIGNETEDTVTFNSPISGTDLYVKLETVTLSSALIYLRTIKIELPDRCNDIDGDDYTIGDGDCDDNDASIFTALSNPTITGNTDDICAGTTATLTATNSGGTTNWYSDSTGLDLLETGTSYTTSELSTTTSFYVQEAAGGSCSSELVEVTVTVNPLPTVTASASDTEVCAGESVTLTGGGAISYSWDKNVLDGESFVPTETTTYTVTGTDTNGCENTAEVTVTVNPLPLVDDPADVNECDSYILPTLINGNYFTGPDGTGTALSSGDEITSTQTIYVYNEPNTTPICTAENSFLVTILSDEIDVDQPADQSLCSGQATDPVMFTGGEPGTIYNWTTEMSPETLDQFNYNVAVGTGPRTTIWQSFTAGQTGNLSKVSMNFTHATASGTLSIHSGVGTSGAVLYSRPFSVSTDYTWVDFTTDFIPITAGSKYTMSFVCSSGTIWSGYTANANGGAGQTLQLSGLSALQGYAVEFKTFISPVIGLADSGTGDIPSFTVVNDYPSTVTATITVTPALNGCEGTPQSFAISVDPLAQINQPANQSICEGSATSEIVFSGGITGTTYSWTNDNPTIGLAASGTGNIPAFTLVNNGLEPEIATITVSQSANECNSTQEKSFTITVYPNGEVNQPANQELCSGESTAPVDLFGGPTGTVYKWTNDTPSIGLAASGYGSIGSITTTNNSTIPVTATITITPSIYASVGNECFGETKSFTITVNPGDTQVDQPANQTLCSGQATDPVVFTGGEPGTIYNWTTEMSPETLDQFNYNVAVGTGPRTTIWQSFTAGQTGNLSKVSMNFTHATASGTLSIHSGVGTSGTILYSRPFSVSTDYTWVDFTTDFIPITAGSKYTMSFVCSSGTIWSGYTANANGGAGQTLQLSGLSVLQGYAVEFKTFISPVIGLAGSGTGDIPSFTATNNNTVHVTATVTVIPSLDGCLGIPKTFTMAVSNETGAEAPTTADLTYCVGDTATALAATATGTGTLTWYDSDSTTVLAEAPTPSTATAGDTTYYVTQTENNCESPQASITVTVHAIPDAPTVNTPVEYCVGDTSTALTATATGIGTLTWYDSDGTTVLPEAPIPSTATAGDTTYYVTQTENNCESPQASITVTVNPLPTVTFEIASCQWNLHMRDDNNNDWQGGFLELSINGASPIVYMPAFGSNTTIVPLSITPGGTLDQTFTGGNWTNEIHWWITDDQGNVVYGDPNNVNYPETGASPNNIACQPGDPCVIPQIETYCSSPQPDEYCLDAGVQTGLGNGSPTGGVYSGLGVTDDGNGTTFSFDPDVAGIGPHTLTYTFTDANGCSDSASDDVEVFALPTVTANASSLEVCEGESVTLTGGGADNYSWDNGVLDGESFVPTATTTYTVTGTDANGCENTATVTVTVNQLAIPVITGDAVICEDETSTLTTPDMVGYTYCWENTSSPATGSWESLEMAGFSADYSDSQSLALASDNTPYVAYRDDANGGGTTVMRFNGISWENVGTPGFSAGQAYYQSLALASDNTPYVAYEEDGSNGGGTTVMRFNGISWENVGLTGFSTSFSGDQSLALASDNTPYVAYRDYANEQKTTVMRFNGSNWENVGTAGFSAGIAENQSLALTSDNTPYVAYRDTANGYKTTVMSFNGSSWEIVGTAGFSAGNTIYQSLALASDNTPYVAYDDQANGTKTTVMRFNGSNWETVGTAGFSAGSSDYQSLALASDNTPYVAYQDGSNQDKTTVMRFNGSNWETVGTAGFSAGSSDYQSLALASDNTPYVAYQDGSNQDKTTVMRFSTSCLGDTNSLEASEAGNYVVTVTNEAGCTVSSAAFNVTINPLPAAPTVTTPVEYCVGDTATALAATATGTGTLTWYDSDSTTVLSVAPTPSTATGGDTTYYVTQTENNCESPQASITVTVHAIPDAPTVTTPVEYCVGDTATALAAIATGTGTLTWYDSDSTTVLSGAPTPSTATAGDTNYYVTQTENNCESPQASITVTVNALPEAGTSAGTITICANDSVSEADLLANLTSEDAGGSWTDASDNAVAFPITTAGDYTYTVSGTGTCSAESDTATVTVAVNPLPTLTASGTDVTCASDGTQPDDGTATVNITGGSTGGNTIAEYTSYAVFVTAARQAGVPNIYIAPDPGFAPFFGDITPTGFDLVCNSSGACNYEGQFWSFGQGDYTTLMATYNDLYPNAILLSNSIPDPAGCTGFGHGCPIPTNPGVATISTPTYTYLWDDPAAQDTATATGLSAGTYTVTVTDANGCTATASVTITEPDPIVVTANASSLEVCAGESVTLTGGGAATYTWDNGVTDGVAFEPIETTTFTVTGTDANGCMNTAEVTVTVNPLPTVTFTAPADLCLDAGVQTGLGGGTPTGGVYSGTGVTDDGNGLTFTFDPTVPGAGLIDITYTYSTPAGWNQVGINMTGATSGDYFGEALDFSANGNRAIVGALGNDEGGSEAGQAKVFEWNGSVWVQIGQDFNGSGDNEYLGDEVEISLDGNRIAISSTNSNSPGTVNVYEWNGSTWMQLGTTFSGNFSKYGDALSFSGDGNRLAIGFPGTTGDEVEIYDWNGTAWVQVGLTLNGDRNGDRFGTEVSLSADGMRLAVGASENNGGLTPRNGYVKVFDWNGASWVQVGQKMEGNPAVPNGLDSFGNRLDLSANGMRVAVAVPGSDVVQVYDYNGTMWVQSGADIPALIFNGGNVDLSDSGNRILVPNGSTVKILDWNGSAWVQVGAAIPTSSGDPDANISADGQRILVGNPFLNSQTGEASVFQLGLSCSNAASDDLEVIVCNQPPTVVCQPLTVDADTNCEGTAEAVDFNDGSTDPDGDLLTYTVSPEGPYPKGTTEVTLSVSDGTESVSCTTSITVVDNTPPVVTCPADITVSNDPSLCGAQVSLPISSIDNCIGVSLDVTTDPSVDLVISNIGKFVDVFSSDSSLIGTPQEIVFGPDGNIYVSIEGPERIVRFDNLTGAYIDDFVPQGVLTSSPLGMAFGPDGNLYVSVGINSFVDDVFKIDGTTGAVLEVFDIGVVNLIDLTFGPDGDLYIGSSSGEVIKLDTSNGVVTPFISYPNIFPFSLTFGPDGNLYVNDFDNILRFDGTSGAFIDTFVSGAGFAGEASFGPDGNFFIAVNNQVKRYNGNTGAFIDVFAENSALQYPKGFAFGPDGQLYAINQGPLGGENSIVRFRFENNYDGFFPVGTTEVNATASDLSGNSAQCTFTVTVEDDEAPVITCPEDIIQDNDADVCEAVVTWDPPAGADNCTGFTVTSTHNPGDTFPVGRTDVTYTVTDAAGLTAKCSFTVTVVNVVIDKIIEDVSCFGESDGSVDITVSGGVPPYTYAWTGPGYFSASTQDLSGLEAGTYVLTVTDSTGESYGYGYGGGEGCNSTMTFTINQPDEIVIDKIIEDASCFGVSDGSVDITVTGGTAPYTYAWSGPGYFSATTEDLSDLEAGTYEVTVTDSSGDGGAYGYGSGGCTSSMTVIIGQPDEPLADNPDDVTECGSYELPALTNGNYFTGPDGTGDALNAGDIIDVTQTIYVYAGADTCFAENSFTVNINPLPTVAVNAINSSCFADDGSIDITVTGGTAPYTYDWSGPGYFSASTEDISDLEAGTYEVTVTDSSGDGDAYGYGGGGCTSSMTITIEQLDAIIIDADIEDVSCLGGSDGSVDITVTGGTTPYTYAWTGPGYFSATTEDLSDLVAGNYDLTVTDDNGCTASYEATIYEPVYGSSTGLNIKVFLGGPYATGTGTMNYELSYNGQTPTDCPYVDEASCHTSVFNTSGNDAIVDWVWLELRDGTDGITVIESKSALIQADGDVVGTDGVSPVSFDVASANYYVMVSHRNHLGVLTANPISITACNVTNVDLTTNINMIYGGANGAQISQDGRIVLYPGDCNGDGQIQNTDKNEASPLRGLSGYINADVDMNGEVQNSDINSYLNPNIGKGVQTGDFSRSANLSLHAKRKEN